MTSTKCIIGQWYMPQNFWSYKCFIPEKLSKFLKITLPCPHMCPRSVWHGYDECRCFIDCRLGPLAHCLYFIRASHIQKGPLQALDYPTFFAFCLRPRWMEKILVEAKLFGLETWFKLQAGPQQIVLLFSCQLSCSSCNHILRIRVPIRLNLCICRLHEWYPTFSLVLHRYLYSS